MKKNKSIMLAINNKINSTKSSMRSLTNRKDQGENKICELKDRVGKLVSPNQDKVTKKVPVGIPNYTWHWHSEKTKFMVHRTLI